MNNILVIQNKVLKQGLHSEPTDTKLCVRSKLSRMVATSDDCSFFPMYLPMFLKLSLCMCINFVIRQKVELFSVWKNILKSLTSQVELKNQSPVLIA